MFDFRKSVVALLAAASVGGLLSAMTAGVQAQTLKAVMHSDVKILDPIWTTAYIVRNHGYLIYDTLFAWTPSSSRSRRWSRSTTSRPTS